MDEYAENLIRVLIAHLAFQAQMGAAQQMFGKNLPELTPDQRLASGNWVVSNVANIAQALTPQIVQNLAKGIAPQPQQSNPIGFVPPAPEQK